MELKEKQGTLFTELTTLIGDEELNEDLLNKISKPKKEYDELLKQLKQRKGEVVEEEPILESLNKFDNLKELNEVLLKVPICANSNIKELNPPKKEKGQK